MGMDPRRRMGQYGTRGQTPLRIRRKKTKKRTKTSISYCIRAWTSPSGRGPPKGYSPAVDSSAIREGWILSFSHTHTEKLQGLRPAVRQPHASSWTCRQPQNYLYRLCSVEEHQLRFSILAWSYRIPLKRDSLSESSFLPHQLSSAGPVQNAIPSYLKGF